MPKRPLPGWRVAPLTVQLYAAYGGFCSICERPITGYANCVDGRTGATLVDECGIGDWDSMLLLCFACWDAHRSDPVPYDRSELLLPYDEFRVSIDPDPTFTYLRRTVVLLMQDGDEIIDERTTEIVEVLGMTDRARRTIEHFKLNESLDGDGTLFRVTLGGDWNRDGRLRARDAAWRSSVQLQPLLERYHFELGGEVLRAVRSTLACAGCWSTSITNVWEATRNAELVCALFENRHDGISEVPVLQRGERLPATRRIVAGADPGNEWAGTRNEWTEQFQESLKYARV